MLSRIQSQAICKMERPLTEHTNFSATGNPINYSVGLPPIPGITEVEVPFRIKNAEIWALEFTAISSICKDADFALLSDFDDHSPRHVTNIEILLSIKRHSQTKPTGLG